MNWNEFKKGLKKTKYTLAVRNPFTHGWSFTEINGYPFDKSTFITKSEKSNLWTIVDIDSGCEFAMFADFDELLYRWKNDLKKRLLRYRKTKEYKKAVIKRIEAENERRAKRF